MLNSKVLSRRASLMFLLACVGILVAEVKFVMSQQVRPKLGAPIRDAQRRFRRHVRNHHALKRQNVVMQQRDYSCGAAALATLIRFHLGDPATENAMIEETIDMLTIEEMRDRYKNGLSLTDLRRLAIRRGYLATMGRLKLEKLRSVKTPVIVGIVVDGFNHFVVFRGMGPQFVYLADPARGNVRTPIEVFRRQWQKNTVLVVVKDRESPIKNSKLRIHADELKLGRQNSLFLRRQLTTRSAAP